MASSLHSLTRQFVQKLAIGLSIVVLGLLLGGLRLYLHDRANAAESKPELLAKLNADRRRESVALDDVNQRIDSTRVELGQLELRERMLNDTINQLHKMRSWWQSWFGDRDKQKVYAERLDRDQQLKKETTAREAELRRTLRNAEWEKDGLEIEIGWLDKRIHAVQANQSSIILYYLVLAWNKFRWCAAAVLGLYFLGPTLGKLLVFFGLSQLIESGRPVRLAGELFALPRFNEKGRQLNISLWPGERLWAKESFLKAADENLSRRTRVMLDWRTPLTCLLCGLFDLASLRNTQAGHEYSVTLADDYDLTAELALISLPEGGSLVLRPSFLKAVILGPDTELKVRRHWRFFTWQSWIGLQFRFFEFAGPCRLVVASDRGVYPEHLAERDGQLRSAGRASRNSVIGFTPNLEYGLVRSGQFKTYFSDDRPLFDELLVGPGLFLSQGERPRDEPRFWADFWSGTLKVLGI